MRKGEMMSKFRDAIETVVEQIEIEYGESSITKIIREFLSKPLRNCDVGTPQDQIKRWDEFCLEHHEQWKPGKSLTAIQRCNCPCYEGNSCNYFIWAQMPYEEAK
jgi:hypothetical protein